MKGRLGFFLVLIGLVALIEYYCFVALSTSIRSMVPKRRVALYWLYGCLTLIGWASLFWLRYVSEHEFPRNVKALILAGLFGFVMGKAVIAAIMLIADIFGGGRWVYRKITQPAIIELKADDNGLRITRSVFISRMALLTGGLLMGGFLWGTTNRYRYQLKKLSLSLKGLPDALKGLKIVQISDIHSGSFDDLEAVARGVSMIMEQKPDLIVFTGDLVNDRSTEIEPYIDIFSRLKAPLGVYSTLGNHDYGDYVQWPSEAAKRENLEKLKQHHATMGWKLMMNEHVILNKNGQDFALIGVENWSSNPRFPKFGKLDKAYAGIDSGRVPLQILLSHDPSHWDGQILKEYKDINLTLSGHTHGMQFGIELPWMKWSPSQYVYDQWAGLYSSDQQHLYVNRGYGFLGYQGRIGILPEITVIEFA